MFSLFGKPNIAKMTEKKDIDGLIKALEYGRWDHPKDQEVRLSSAEALARISDSGIVNRLVGMAHKGAAHLALVRIGPPAVDAIIGALEYHLEQHWDGSRAGWFVTPYIDILAEIGDPCSIDVVIKALADKSVQSTAAEALVRFGEPAVGPLIAALRDTYNPPGLREAAADVLQQMGIPEAEAAYQDYLAGLRQKEEKEKRKRDKKWQMEHKKRHMEQVELGYELPDSIYKKRLDDLVQGNRYQIERELVAVGRPVIPHLIVALNCFNNWLTRSEKVLKEDPENEHMAWQVDAFSSALTSVYTMLEEITGQKLGRSLRSWDQWWQQEDKKTLETDR